MKTPHRHPSRRAFTLIELLVVVSIIALLISLVTPTVIGVIERGRTTQARSVLAGLTSAINNYQSDYNRYPVALGSGSESEIDLSAGSDLLKVLLGENVDRLNPKQQNYLDNVQMGKGGAGGLVGKEESFALVDPWGTPYRVIVDANADDRVSNPDARNADTSIAGEAPKMLPRRAIAFSAGHDKKFGTADDVVSWR